MSSIGLYIPKPYPDELLYSVFARLALHLKIKSPKRVLMMLFGTTNVITTTDLPGQLGRLEWIFQQRWGLSVSEASMRYTLLPYYVSNRGLKIRQSSIEVLKNADGHHLHKQLGICATTVQQPKVLRFCIECINKDGKMYGEPYWHRSHQLPGVLVCPEHGTPLSLSHVSYRPQARHAFVALTKSVIQNALRESLLQGKQAKILWEIARRSKAILDDEINNTSLLDKKELISRLDDIGFDRSYGSTQRLERDFIRFYGQDTLSKLDSGFEQRRSLSWLVNIRRNDKRVLHPLRQILMEYFIEKWNPPHLRKNDDKGPWPCLNWLAKHYKKPVVTQMEEFKDKRHPEYELGRFSCSCGFVYSQRVDLIASGKPYQVIEFGSLFKKEATELYSRGYKVGCIARLLDVDWKTVKRFIDPPIKIIQDEQYRIDKNKWLALLANNETSGAKALRQLEPALYARLYRNDREWLRLNTPKKCKQRHAISRVVDWESRDEELKDKIAAMTEVILEERPPRRLTRNLIGTRLGCRAMLEKKMHMLPKSREIIEAVQENNADFRLRRLQVAIDQLGPGIGISSLLRAANIRKNYVDDGIEAELKNLLSFKPKNKRVSEIVL